MIGGQGGLTTPAPSTPAAQPAPMLSDPAVIYSPEAEANRDRNEAELISGALKVTWVDGKMKLDYR